MNPPPYAGPPRPWLPPPRKRNLAPLIVLLALGALGAATIGVIYYSQDYRPRKALQDWSQELSAPQGRFMGGDQGGDNHARFLHFSEQCLPSYPCAPSPIDAITDWIENDAGPGVTKEDVGRCFRDGGYVTFGRDGHHAQIQCRQVLNATFEFEVRLDY